MASPTALDLQFHGVRCRILFRETSLYEPLVSLFGHALESKGAPELSVTIEPGERAPERPAAPTFVVISDQNIWGELSRSGLVMSDGRSTARVDYARSSATLEVMSTDYAALYSAVHRHFPIALGELLRTRGVYYLHAAAVAGASGAVIMAGDSEAGKSTLAYTAMRDGMKLLGDDGLLFSIGADGEAYVEPYYRELTLHEATLTPEDRARATPSEPMFTGDPRVRLVPHASRCATRARVRAVLGIQRAKQASSITPTSRLELFGELVRQNLFVSLTPQLAGAHLGALGQLVRTTRLGVVHSGPDIIGIPGATARLLEAWLAPGPHGEAPRDGVPSAPREDRVRPS